MIRGYTLLETIIAGFLLVAVLLISAGMFHASLRYSVWSENKAIATHLAEKRMVELRRWAQTSGGWHLPPTGNDPDYPGFEIVVRLEEPSLASPSTHLESTQPEPRSFGPSLRRAIVEVSRGGATDKIQLVSLLRGPRIAWRRSDPIEVTADRTDVGPTTTVRLRAVGFTADGPIPDLCFTWSVEPEFPNGATGTLRPLSDGRQAEFQNIITTSSGTFHSTGHCRVYATAIYGGREARGSSPILNLAP